MKTSKKILLLLLTVILTAGMAIPAVADVDPSYAVTKREETATISFIFENIAGVEGVITFSNPEIFSDIELVQNGLANGSYNEEQGKISYYGTDIVEKVSVDVNYTMLAELEGGTTCDITLKYRTTDEEGNLSEWKTETATIMVPYLRLLGDVNYDGKIDKKDYALIKRYCFDLTKLEGGDFDAADIDRDGEVDRKDYVRLKRYCFDMATFSTKYIEVSELPSK